MTIALRVPFIGGLNGSPGGAGAGESPGRLHESCDAAPPMKEEGWHKDKFKVVQVLQRTPPDTADITGVLDRTESVEG